MDEIDGQQAVPLSPTLSIVTITSAFEQRKHTFIDVNDNQSQHKMCDHINDGLCNTCAHQVVVDMDVDSDANTLQTELNNINNTLNAQNINNNNPLLKNIINSQSFHTNSQNPAIKRIMKGRALTIDTISAISYQNRTETTITEEIDGDSNKRQQNNQAKHSDLGRTESTASTIHGNHTPAPDINTRVTNFMSILYAMIVIAINVLVCIYDMNTSHNTYTNTVMILMNTMSFAWILFLHWDIKRYKRWAVQYLTEHRRRVSANPPEVDNSSSYDILTPRMNVTSLVLFNSVTTKKPTVDNPDEYGLDLAEMFRPGYTYCQGHSGKFYLKCGMIVFCFGSLVHMSVQVFTETYFYINNTTICQDSLKILCYCVRMIFSFYQLFIAFKYSNIIINRNQTLSRFALMHLLATSLSSWFRTILSEAIEDYVENEVNNIYETNDTINTNQLFGKLIEHEMHCLDNTIINDKSLQTLPYLYPFTIEFNIIMASIWYICWTNIGSEHSHKNTQNKPKPRKLSDGETTAEAMDREFEYRSAISVSADCHASNRGLFAGITTLLGTAVSIIIFFATQGYSHFGLSVYSAQIGVLTIMCSIVIPLAYYQTRGLNVVSGEHFNCSHTVMDDLLVLIPVPFFLLHYSYLIWADVHDPSQPVNLLLVVIYVLTILQVLVQSPFIVDGIRRCANTRQLRVAKPGRNWIMLALILNITLWILNTLELRFVDRYQGMENIFGKLTWMILSNANLPLMLFYRFHSSVCLSHIWVNGYEKDPTI